IFLLRAHRRAGAGGLRSSRRRTAERQDEVIGSMRPLRICEAMTRAPRVCHPEHTLHDCARIMAETDVGALPVGENGVVVGMITDRDIAVRGVAARKGYDTRVREVMTPKVLCCS